MLCEDPVCTASLGQTAAFPKKATACISCSGSMNTARLQAPGTFSRPSRTNPTLVALRSASITSSAGSTATFKTIRSNTRASHLQPTAQDNPPCCGSSVRHQKRPAVVTLNSTMLNQQGSQATSVLAAASETVNHAVQLSVSEPLPAPRQPRFSKAQQEVVSGAASGAAVSALLFPVNTVKTRLMAGGQLLTRATFSNLWAGSRFDLVAQAVTTAVFFGAYGRAKSRISESKGESNINGIDTLKAGAAAGLASSLFAVPAEVVRQHVQARVFPKAPAAVVGIVRKYGPQGLYRGYGASLARDLPFDAMQITVYEVLRRSYLAARSKTDLSPTETAGLGGAAGAITGLLSTPLDSVRTYAVLKGATGGHHLSMKSAASELLRNKGVRGLFRGAGARSLEIALGGMVFFTVLERAQYILAQQTVGASSDTAPAAKSWIKACIPTLQEEDYTMEGRLAFAAA